MERKRADNHFDSYNQTGNRRSTEKPLDMLNISKLNEDISSSFDRQKPVIPSYTVNDYENVTNDVPFSRGPLDDGRTGNSAEITDMFKKLNDTHVSEHSQKYLKKMFSLSAP